MYMFDALKASKFTTTPFLNSWHLSLSENLTFIYVRSKKNFPIYRRLSNPIAAATHDFGLALLDEQQTTAQTHQHLFSEKKQTHPLL